MVKRKWAWLSLAVGTCLAASALAQSVNNKRWTKDFDQLRAALSKDYANLDWAIEKHGIDPVALNNQIFVALSEARSNAEARAALQSFIDAFRDPHLTLSDPASRPANGLRDKDRLPADQPAAEVCRTLGFAEGDPDGYNFALTEHYAFNVWISQRNVFDAGILDLDRGRVGYLRIASFQTTDYPSACERAWRARSLETDEGCNGDCRRDLVDRDIPNLILDDLARRLEGFAERRVGEIVVDVVDNGGGNSWAVSAAQMVGGADLVCPRIAVPRSRAWRDRFEDTRKALRRDLRGAEEPLRTVLENGLGRLDALIDETRAACSDREVIWDAVEVDPCVRLTNAAYSACGLFETAPEVNLADTRTGNELYKPSYFQTTTPPRAQRVKLLTNGNTASAAELFASILETGDEVTLIGETTFGAGCGYLSDGGETRLRLKHSKLEVRLPNCQRLRADGMNEAEGLEPDLPLTWPDAATSATARDLLLDVLERQ